MMKTPLLSVKNLTIAYQSPSGSFAAVDHLSFSIKEGEIFALVGESGCGKSTAALGFMRLVPEPGSICSGEIEFEGRDLLSLPEKEMEKVRGRRMGMIFQNPLDSLNPVYTVGNQIQEAVVLDKITKKEGMKKAIELLRDVRISDPSHRASNFPHELSGGMRQRVMIGMMLSRNPKLLIADEPTTALDVTIQAQILDLCKDLKEKYGTSILIITHDFGIVAEIADKVGVMYAGKLVEVGEVFKIFDQPLHPYTRLLMKALPQTSKKEGRLKTIPGTVPNLMNPPTGCRFHPRCPFTEQICREKAPPMESGGEDHYFACHRKEAENGSHT